MISESNRHAPAGLYIHIPFCVRKCRYCNFYSTTALQQRPEFIRALHAEMPLAHQPGWTYDTLYFGGGTPSLLTPNHIAELVQHAVNRFNLSPHSEITLEVNPGTADLAALTGYRTAGISRINIGVQSFQDHHLTRLGRVHSARDAGTCLANARRAGFERIGIDLMYGLPGQSAADWTADLTRAVQTGVTHISAYMLSYEPGTPIYAQMRAAQFKPLSDAAVAMRYHQTVAHLAAAGFHQYEVSNFARGADQRSIHNCKYWSGHPYLGLGPAAHSFDGARRWWNGADLADYIARLKKGISPVQHRERLDHRRLWTEMVYLGLRHYGGLNFQAARDLLGFDPADRCRALMQRLTAEGYAHSDDRGCLLTSKGMLMLDAIVQQVLLATED